MEAPVTVSLSRKEWMVAIYAALVTFLAYATIYGFRKSYTVGTFDGQTVLGLGYKEVLVIVQALGYMSSKFFGIKFISELKRFGRWKIIIGLVLISWLAWLLFAVVPAPINIVFLFMNGFPLGLLWGILFSYIEGRKTTDLIGAAMAVSFIFSSGFVKTVSQYILIHWNISEHWMPFAAGALFFPFLLVFVFMLEKIPPPTAEDIELRQQRVSMSGEQRRDMLRNFLPGIALLVILYVFLTILRDVRDNFVADMWKEMGFFNQPALFTKTETPIAVLTLILMASLIVVRKSYIAMVIIHWIVLAGFLIAGISSALFIAGLLSPVYWVTATGLGLYMGYIPYNCVLFERFIATFKLIGNVGFLIYIADSFGYLGSVSIILTKAIMKMLDKDVQWTIFYSNSVVIFCIIGTIGLLISMRYFRKKHIQYTTLNEQ
jgi:MFS family permease